jgi:hypothetical protein
MSATDGTRRDGQDFEVATEASKLTAVVEIRGAIADVLERGTNLVGFVTEALGDAELLHLRLDYDPASRPSHVVPVGAGDVLEVVGRGAMASQEAQFWRLALRTDPSRRDNVKARESPSG